MSARSVHERILSRSLVLLPRRTHAKRLCEVESNVHGVADLRRKKVQRVRRGRVEQRSLAYLLDGALGQEVGLLMVRIVMVLGWLRVRLQAEREDRN